MEGDVAGPSRLRLCGRQSRLGVGRRQSRLSLSKRRREGEIQRRLPAEQAWSQIREQCRRLGDCQERLRDDLRLLRQQLGELPPSSLLAADSESLLAVSSLEGQASSVPCSAPLLPRSLFEERIHEAPPQGPIRAPGSGEEGVRMRIIALQEAVGRMLAREEAITGRIEGLGRLHRGAVQMALEMRAPASRAEEPCREACQSRPPLDVYGGAQLVVAFSGLRGALLADLKDKAARAGMAVYEGQPFVESVRSVEARPLPRSTLPTNGSIEGASRSRTSSCRPGAGRSRCSLPP